LCDSDRTQACEEAFLKSLEYNPNCERTLLAYSLFLKQRKEHVLNVDNLAQRFLKRAEKIAGKELNPWQFDWIIPINSASSSNTINPRLRPTRFPNLQTRQRSSTNSPTMSRHSKRASLKAPMVSSSSMLQLSSRSPTKSKKKKRRRKHRTISRSRSQTHHLAPTSASHEEIQINDKKDKSDQVLMDLLQSDWQKLMSYDGAPPTDVVASCMGVLQALTSCIRTHEKTQKIAFVKNGSIQILLQMLSDAQSGGEYALVQRIGGFLYHFGIHASFTSKHLTFTPSFVETYQSVMIPGDSEKVESFHGFTVSYSQSENATPQVGLLSMNKSHISKSQDFIQLPLSPNRQSRSSKSSSKATQKKNWRRSLRLPKR